MRLWFAAFLRADGGRLHGECHPGSRENKGGMFALYVSKSPEADMDGAKDKGEKLSGSTNARSKGVAWARPTTECRPRGEGPRGSAAPTSWFARDTLAPAGEAAVSVAFAQEEEAFERGKDKGSDKEDGQGDGEELDARKDRDPAVAAKAFGPGAQKGTMRSSSDKPPYSTLNRQIDIRQTDPDTKGKMARKKGKENPSKRQGKRKATIFIGGERLAVVTARLRYGKKEKTP